jgi:aspartate ammonia-lyase
MMMSITQLTAGCYTLADRCVNGITANTEKLRHDVERSIGLVTALSPTIGYENATEVAKRAQVENASVKEVVVAMGLLSADEFNAILGNVDKLTAPQGT